MNNIHAKTYLSNFKSYYKSVDKSVENCVFCAVYYMTDAQIYIEAITETDAIVRNTLYQVMENE